MRSRKRGSPLWPNDAAFPFGKCMPLLNTDDNCAKHFTTSPCFSIASFAFSLAMQLLSCSRRSFSRWYCICSENNLSCISILDRLSSRLASAISFICPAMMSLLALVACAMRVCPDKLFLLTVVLPSLRPSLHSDASLELINTGVTPFGSGGRPLELGTLFHTPSLTPDVVGLLVLRRAGGVWPLLFFVASICSAISMGSYVIGSLSWTSSSSTMMRT